MQLWLLTSLCQHPLPVKTQVMLASISIIISLVLFIFRSRWFLQGYSIISSPRSLCSSSIQPLQNHQSRWRDWELYWESEMYKVNMNGDSRVPCGAPVLHISKSDKALAHPTYCGLSVRQSVVHGILDVFTDISCSSSLSSSRWIMLNALGNSKKVITSPLPL